MVSSVGSSALSSATSALFSRLDTKNKGYIEKSDLQSALSQIDKSGSTSSTSSTASTDTTKVDALFKALDTSGDGKVTKDELSSALAKVADTLNSQYDQSRVQKASAGATGAAGGPGGAGGPPPGPPPSGGDGASSSPSSTSSSSTSSTSSSTTYNAAADLNGDGTVSADEQAIYDASGGSDSTATSDASSTTSATASAASASQGTSRKPDVGFSKDELTSQIKEIGSTDPKRAALLNKLVDNFDKADANGDGKINGTEARTFDKAGKVASTSTDNTARNTESSVAKTILDLLRAYGVGDSTGQNASSSSSSSSLSVLA